MAFELKLSPQNQQIVVPIVIIAGLYLGFSYLYSPTVNKIKEVENTLQTEKAKLTSYKDASRDLHRLRLEVEKLDFFIGESMKKMPLSSEMPKLLKSFTDSAVRYGVDINVWQPLPPAKKEYVQEMTFKISGATNFHNLARFLSEIGQMERIMNTSNLIFTTTTGGENKNNTLVMNFLLTTYVWLEKPTEAKK
ncbi:MAG: type 4a pilus biogenesis protein PilO [Elusimicrobiota bacterium]